MTPSEYITKLTEISQKKIVILKEILILTKRQSENIQEDCLDTLKYIVEEKQRFMDDVDKLDDAFEVYFKRLKSTLGIESLDKLTSNANIGDTATLKNHIQEIFNLLNQIDLLDKDNNEKGKTLMTKLSTEIKKVNQKKIINNGYKPASSMPQQSLYFDTKK